MIQDLLAVQEFMMMMMTMIIIIEAVGIHSLMKIRRPGSLTSCKKKKLGYEMNIPNEKWRTQNSKLFKLHLL